MGLSPLDPQELLERCDLAGLARVESVGRADPHARNLARLRFVELLKGEPRDRRGNSIRWVVVALQGGLSIAADGSAQPRGWSDWWDYPVGATVRTHLSWNADEGVYHTTWPGAVSALDDDWAEVA